MRGAVFFLGGVTGLFQGTSRKGHAPFESGHEHPCTGLDCLNDVWYRL